MKKGAEVWLINPKDATLYRTIDKDFEWAIPIKGNESVREFNCTPGEKFDEYVEELIRE